MYFASPNKQLKHTFMFKHVAAVIIAAFLLPITGFAQNQPDVMPDMRSRDIIYLGIKAHDNEHYDSALAMFNWIHPNDTNYSWAVAEKANTLLEMERYEEAINLCEDALKMPIGHKGSIYMSLGTAYDEMEQSEKALDAYDRGIANSPMLERLHFNKAVTHIRRDEYQESYECLKRALTINPYHSGSHYVIGLLAKDQGDYVVATLATGAYLMLQPEGERSLNALADLNKALSEKQDIIDHHIDFGEDFNKLNLVVRNYVAVRESYKTPSDFELPVVKQSHLIFNQLKLNKKGWISNFYGTFFKDVVADDKMFEGYSYLIMMSSTSENHQKVIERNMSKIQKFADWADPKWNELHGYVMDTLAGKEVEVRYLRRGDHSVEAVGSWDKKTDRPSGLLRIYDSNGTLSAVGEFDKNGERTGIWHWYYDTGVLREVQEYKAGKSTGLGKFYDNNGYLAITQEWKDDERNGERKTYFITGAVMNKSTYTNGEMEGTYTSYYPQGGVDYTVNVIAGKQDGLAQSFFPSGEKQSEVTFKEGLRNGTYTSWYSNGQVNEITDFANDESHGAHKTYYPNGQLQREGTFVNGKRSGVWKGYYADGTLDYTEEYDENGKQTGVYRDYDNAGNVCNEMEYKKGDVVAYRYFDLDGKLISETKARKGKLDFKAYHYNRQISAEGVIMDDKKDGTWKYYNEYGMLTSIETYDEGMQTGIDYGYFDDGKLESMKKFEDDDAHGLYLEFYSDSTLYCQGRYVKGKQEGPWYYYNPDGSQRALIFYLNGKLDGEQKYYSTTGKLDRVTLVREGLYLAYTYYGPDGNIIGDNKLEGGNGKISWKFPNGKLAYEATLVNGQFQGPVKSYYPDGKVHMQGQYAYGDAEGTWKWYHANGELATLGYYKDDLRDSTWTWYFENGKLSSKSNYVLGNYEGLRKEYNQEGILTSTTNYLQDLMHGDRIHYGEDSTVAMKRVYRHGTIISYSYLGKDGNYVPEIPVKNGDANVKCYYPNGKLAVQFTYNNGYFDGEYVRYYVNGNVMHKANVIGGRDDGMMLDYFSTGKVESEVDNKLDNRHGEARFYHQNGKLWRVENYVYGKREGEAKEYDEQGKLIRTEFWFNDDLFSVE